MTKLIEFLIELLNFYQNRESLKLGGAQRSPKWESVRKNHLLKEPICKVCGGNEKIQVHHKIPFNQKPELELDEKNLITLCETPSRNCHLNFGHLGSFRSWNESVENDSENWRHKILTRP